MKKIRISTLVVVAALGGLAFAQAVHKGVKPGLYETTSTMEMIGTPYAPPPTTSQHCITPEEAADAKKSFGKASKDCTLTNQRAEGNKVTFTMECATPRGKSTGTGEVVYGADSMASTFNMEMEIPQRGRVKLTRKSVSHRVGDCK